MEKGLIMPPKLGKRQLREIEPGRLKNLFVALRSAMIDQSLFAEEDKAFV